MNKLYLIILPAEFNRDTVISYLESNQKITTWFYSLPYSFFVRSSLSATQLREIIDANFVPPRIFITEINNNIDYAGRIPDAHHQYFGNLQ